VPSITASSARAGPRGLRLPLLQLRMVSTGTPSARRFELGQARAAAQVAHQRPRFALCPALTQKVRSWRDGSLRRRERNSRPSRNSTIRPSAFSRKRCIINPQARIVGDAP